MRPSKIEKADQEAFGENSRNLSPPLLKSVSSGEGKTVFRALHIFS
jgi:hypothetical protein